MIETTLERSASGPRQQETVGIADHDFRSTLPAQKAVVAFEPDPRPVPGHGRLASLDALRGFDMLWLIGGARVALDLLARVDKPWARALSSQFQHVAWDGFHFLDLIFPLKNRWTSSYALVAGGLSFLLLAGFYLVIDIWGYRKWAFPLTVIGMNSLAAYMLASLFFPTARHAAEVFLGGLKPYAGAWYPAILSAGALTVVWLVLYWMYRSRTFLRV